MSTMTLSPSTSTTLPETMPPISKLWPSPRNCSMSSEPPSPATTAVSSSSLMSNSRSRLRSTIGRGRFHPKCGPQPMPRRVGQAGGRLWQKGDLNGEAHSNPPRQGAWVRRRGQILHQASTLTTEQFAVSLRCDPSNPFQGLDCNGHSDRVDALKWPIPPRIQFPTETQGGVSGGLRTLPGENTLLPGRDADGRQEIEPEPASAAAPGDSLRNPRSPRTTIVRRPRTA